MKRAGTVRPLPSTQHHRRFSLLQSRENASYYLGLAPECPTVIGVVDVDVVIIRVLHDPGKLTVYVLDCAT